MILFVSDMHFGRGASHAPGTQGDGAEADGAGADGAEAALIDCLEAHAGAVDHLYLVGDVFDCYLEYRHLVPKGFVRFQGLLARWTDAGVPVTYVVGNHDPWHRDHFRDELGVRLVDGPLEARHYGRSVRLSHGDEVASTHRLFGALRDWMRHPAPVWLYRALLPADLGVRLARWASRALHDDAPDPDVVRALRRRARSRLREAAVDGVVMGHSHVPALHRWPEGTYLNTGNWYDARTLGRLDADGFHLLRWNGTRALSIEPAELPSR